MYADISQTRISGENRWISLRSIVVYSDRRFIQPYTVFIPLRFTVSSSPSMLRGILATSLWRRGFEATYIAKA